MSGRFHRTWQILAAGAIVGALLATAQPATPPKPAPTPTTKFEYANLSRSLTVSREGGQRGGSADWRLCSPAEDLDTEASIVAKYGGQGRGALTEVAVINGLAAGGWELVTHSQTTEFEFKTHNGTNTGETRVTLDQWWLRRAKATTTPPTR
jgi:hypothetical protein